MQKILRITSYTLFALVGIAFILVLGWWLIMTGGIINVFIIYPLVFYFIYALPPLLLGVALAFLSGLGTPVGVRPYSLGTQIKLGLLFLALLALSAWFYIDVAFNIH